MRDQGKRGLCGADDTMLVARAALHFWEEPPISGESGSGTVFFAGCPLHCVYCQNAQIAAGAAPSGETAMGEAGDSSATRLSDAAAAPRFRAVGEQRLAEIFLDLQAQGALNVNCVTPTHHSLRIARAVELARARGLRVPVVWNTSGYERVEAVEALSGTVDVYLTDFKYSDAALAQRYSHAPDYPAVALAAIERMVRTAGEPRFDEVGGQPRLVGGVVVRHLVLPGALEQSKRAVRMLHERFGGSVLCSIMNQYTPVMSPEALLRFPELAERVPDGEYEQLLDYADAIGMQDYFWQEGPAAEESFIPAWDGTGV